MVACATWQIVDEDADALRIREHEAKVIQLAGGILVDSGSQRDQLYQIPNIRRTRDLWMRRWSRRRLGRLVAGDERPRAFPARDLAPRAHGAAFITFNFALPIN